MAPRPWLFWHLKLFNQFEHNEKGVNSFEETEGKRSGDSQHWSRSWICFLVQNGLIRRNFPSILFWIRSRPVSFKKKHKNAITAEKHSIPSQFAVKKLKKGWKWVWNTDLAHSGEEYKEMYAERVWGGHGRTTFVSEKKKKTKKKKRTKKMVKVTYNSDLEKKKEWRRIDTPDI